MTEECHLYRLDPLVGALLSAEPYVTVRQSTWELIVAAYPPKDDLIGDGQIVAAHTLQREPENFADDGEVVENDFVEELKTFTRIQPPLYRIVLNPLLVSITVLSAAVVQIDAPMADDCGNAAQEQTTTYEYASVVKRGEIMIRRCISYANGIYRPCVDIGRTQCLQSFARGASGR